MSLMTAAAALNESAQKYKKQLLMLPSIGLTELIPYMTGYPGVTYKQTVGALLANSQLRPYNGDNNEVDTTEMKERTLETFLGSVVELFDPNALKQTVYAQLVANAGKVSDKEFSKAQLMAIMDSVMSYLGTAAWSADRNDAGTTTAELFNGFDTITADEITATKITAGIGNLYQQTAAIDNTNAYDALRNIYKNASPELKRKKVFMFMDPDVKTAYEEDYMATVGAAPYNNKYDQDTLQGSGGMWKLVPQVGKAGSDFITCSTKRNMIYGYGNGVANEKIEVRRGDNAFKLQFILAMFFGTQFATIDPKELIISKNYTGV
jgi:hypothetical protein